MWESSRQPGRYRQIEAQERAVDRGVEAAKQNTNSEAAATELSLNATVVARLVFSWQQKILLSYQRNRKDIVFICRK